jgi:death-on-curing family protein
MKKLSIVEVEYIAYELAKGLMKFDEPIPEFATRFPNILESSLAVPFQEFSGHIAYPGLTAKASILFYLMVKNHPFQNGNKRIAITTLLVFLHINKKWLKIDNQELYNFSVWVAQSPASLKDDVAAGIETFLKKSMTNIV